MGSLIASINSFFYKITNFALGKTVIFIVILGWFLVITGIIFLVQPEKARKKLVSQGLGTVAWGLRLALIYVFLLSLSLAGKINGTLSTLFVIAVLIGLIWTYFYVMKKSLKLITEKLALLSVKTLKGYALVQIIVGALMIMLHRRIW